MMRVDGDFFFPEMKTFPMRRLLVALGLAAGAALSAPAAEVADTPLPIVSQPLTLSWYAGLMPQAAVSLRSLSEQTAYQVLAERTGIHVAFQHPPVGAERERFQLLVVSRRYPDVVEADWADYPGGPAQAIRDGAILPLNALIAQHAPHLQALLDANPEVRRAITTDDGTIYCFPLLSLDPQVRSIWGPQIRQDWLARLHLDAPVTLADWDRVLTAFKARDPNGNGVADEIPLSAFTVPGEHVVPGLPPALTSFLGAFDLAPEFYRAGDQVRYSPAQPAYRDFLALMHRWYVQGLLDPDFVTQSGRQFDTKMMAGRVGAYSDFNGGGLGRYTRLAQGRVPGFALQATAWPADAAGHAHAIAPTAARVFAGTGAAITSADRHVVETVKFLDYGYSVQGGRTLSFGRKGLSYTMVDGQPRYTDRVLRDPRLSVMEAIMRDARPQSGPLVQDPGYLTQFYALPAQRDAVRLWAAGDTDLLLPLLQPSGRDARKFASLMSDIQTYVAEMTVKFILGREPLAGFDAYVARLDAAGLPEATQIMQRAYDRYRAKPVH